LNGLHIYRTKGQPLTRWRLGRDIMDPPSKWFRNHPRSQHRCENCYRIRTAANMQVFAYYDYTRYVCAPKCEPSTYKERSARLRKWRAKTDRAVVAASASPGKETPRE